MRIGNRLAGLLLGLALLAVGLLAALAAALVLAGRRPWPVRIDRWYPALTTTTPRAPLVVGIAIAAAVVGLVLLVLELRPWAPARLALAPARAVDTPDVPEAAVSAPAGDPAGDWWIARRSAERHLGAAADAVAGVRDARVRLRGRKARWTVRVSVRGRREAEAEVEQAVRAGLRRLAAPEPHRFRLSVRAPRRVT